MSYHQRFETTEQHPCTLDFLDRCRKERSTELGVVAKAGPLAMTGMPYLGRSAVRLAYFDQSLLSSRLVMPEEVYHLFFLVPGTLETPLDGMYMRVHPLVEMAQLVRTAAKECARAYAGVLERSGLGGLEFEVQPFIAPSPIHPRMISVGEPYRGDQSTQDQSSQHQVITLISRR